MGPLSSFLAIAAERATFWKTLAQLVGVEIEMHYLCEDLSWAISVADHIRQRLKSEETHVGETFPDDAFSTQ